MSEEQENLSGTKTEIKIKKASLKDEGLYLEYDEIIVNPEDDPVIKGHKFTGGHKRHKDLDNAFASLAIHLALICEQVTDKNADTTIHLIGKGAKKKDITLLLSSLRSNSITLAISVTGFVIGGSDEHEGIVIIGQRKLETGSILNLNSSFQKWESDYKHNEDLTVQMEVVIHECEQYLNGKHAPNPQLELELDTKEKQEAA